jgi:hypothetical protein
VKSVEWAVHVALAECQRLEITVELKQVAKGGHAFAA